LALRHDWHRPAVRQHRPPSSRTLHQLRHHGDETRLLTLILRHLRTAERERMHADADASVPEPGSGAHHAPRSTHRPRTVAHRPGGATSTHHPASSGVLAVTATRPDTSAAQAAALPSAYPPRPAPPTLHPGAGGGAPPQGSPPSTTPPRTTPGSGSPSSGHASAAPGPPSGHQTGSPSSARPPGAVAQVENPLHSDEALFILGAIALVTLIGMAYVFWSGRRPDRA
jgi:hypothetical protein